MPVSYAYDSDYITGSVHTPFIFQARGMGGGGGGLR